MIKYNNPMTQDAADYLSLLTFHFSAALCFNDYCAQRSASFSNTQSGGDRGLRKAFHSLSSIFAFKTQTTEKCCSVSGVGHIQKRDIFSFHFYLHWRGKQERRIRWQMCHSEGKGTVSQQLLYHIFPYNETRRKTDHWYVIKAFSLCNFLQSIQDGVWWKAPSRI